VQEFLAQARRTRDLWAGSYLLSYLAANALLAARGAGGTVVLPYLEGDPLVAAVEGKTAPKRPGDRVGSVPHVAELTAGPTVAREVAQAAVRRWEAAWENLSAVVLDECRQRFPAWTEATQVIWKRQCGRPWWHAWTVDAPHGLGARKSLRNFDQPAEPGESCTCCAHREPLHAGDPRRRAVREYWKAVAQALPPGEVASDGSERLCALCTVKRLVPTLADHALGWPVPRSFPSTTALASLDWRRAILERGRQEARLRSAVTRHVNTVRLVDRRSTGLGRFAGLEHLAAGWGAEAVVGGHFLDLDGDWLYPDDLVRRATDEEIEPSAKQAASVSLRELYNVAASVGVGSPDTAYVLLAMDGDQMGRLLRELSDYKGAVSHALGSFSRRVVELVESSNANGRLIYAGGDDVLAFLPPSTGLATARALRTAYQEAFRENVGPVRDGHTPPTISAGLVYAHMHAPLRAVVRSAHTTLDDMAKDGAGRDAFAVRVWKRAGVALEFAGKWDELDGGALGELEADLRTGKLSASYVHGLPALLEGMQRLSDEVQRAVITAEYLKSRDRPADRAEGERMAQRLQELVKGTKLGGPAAALLFVADRVQGGS
jgi:CRISPR-associated protein Cmr2